MSRRILFPVGIAVLVIAVVSGLLWWVNRTGPIPTTPPSAAPAVGSCWNLDATTAGGQAPWPGTAVDCAAPHTVEVFYVGQVDHSLIVAERRASGQEKDVNSLVMIGEARAGCTVRGQDFLGDSPRGAQVAVLPDFLKPTDDGFYVCAIAQATGPNNDAFVPRTTSLKGQAKAVSISCVAAGTTDALTYVPCDKPHSSEFAGLYTVTPLNAPFDQQQLAAAVPAGCDKIVKAFMGLKDDAKRDDVNSAYVGPKTSGAWIGSDQTFACFAHTATDTSASLAGLGTRPLPH
jgi:hypothetical protein